MSYFVYTPEAAGQAPNLELVARKGEEDRSRNVLLRRAAAQHVEEADKSRFGLHSTQEKQTRRDEHATLRAISRIFVSDFKNMPIHAVAHVTTNPGSESGSFQCALDMIASKDHGLLVGRKQEEDGSYSLEVMASPKQEITDPTKAVPGKYSWRSHADYFGEDQIDEIMKREDVTHTGYQTEMQITKKGVRRFYSRESLNGRHLSAGALDENGTYTPILTVLNISHPARQQQLADNSAA